MRPIQQKISFLVVHAKDTLSGGQTQGCSLIRAYNLICSLHWILTLTSVHSKLPAAYVKEAELESLHTVDSSTALLEKRWRQHRQLCEEHTEKVLLDWLGTSPDKACSEMFTIFHISYGRGVWYFKLLNYLYFLKEFYIINKAKHGYNSQNSPTL